MFDSDPISAADGFSKKASEFLISHKLSPHPVNFSVAYAIVKGQRKNLLQVYQERLASEGQITEFIMRDLFDNFFFSSNEQTLEGQYEGLQGMLVEVVNEMATATSGRDHPQVDGKTAVDAQGQ